MAEDGLEKHAETYSWVAIPAVASSTSWRPTVPDDIKRIDIKEFCDLGFLQEVNRQFFHPRGLALEVTVEEDGRQWISGVWDYRDDPEGMIFNPGVIDQDKVNRVQQELWKHVVARREMFVNTAIQPVDWAPADD